MTISLSNAGQRFESVFQTFEGMPFRGVLMPVPEGSVSSMDFAVPRHILRVRKNSIANTGSHILAPNGQRFLMADHDIAIADNEILYRTHRVFRLNKQVTWEREQAITDSLTGMKKGQGRVLLSNIWIMDEIVQREEIDLAFRVKEQVRRVLTGYDIKLNDIVADMVVRRVDEVFGVKLLELQ